MNESDLVKIEEQLGVKLPLSYRAIMLAYPYPDCESLVQYELVADANSVIELNEHHRKEGWFAIDWPEHYFVIGEDGCGDTYFLVIGKDERVYMADHEGGPHPRDELDDCMHSETVADYVEHSIEIDRLIEEEEARREERKKNKKWWQFWV